MRKGTQYCGHVGIMGACCSWQPPVECAWPFVLSDLVLTKLWCNMMSICYCGRQNFFWRWNREVSQVFHFALDVKISMSLYISATAWPFLHKDDTWWHAATQPWLKAQVARKNPRCCRQHEPQLRLWAQGLERMPLSTLGRRSNSRTGNDGHGDVTQHENRARGPWSWSSWSWWGNRKWWIK